MVEMERRQDWRVYLLLVLNLLVNAALPPVMLISFGILLWLAYKRSRWFVPYLFFFLGSVVLAVVAGLAVGTRVFIPARAAALLTGLPARG